MPNDPLIPEFSVYSIEREEIEELGRRIENIPQESGNRFRIFTDALIDYVPSGEWRNHSDSFITMIARACYLRGMYGYIQTLAKSTKNVACKGYSSASYCRQSLNPRWINNLRNYVNQAWQEKNYIAFTELSTLLAEILVDLGYNDHAEKHAHDTIERVTEATKKDTELKKKVQTLLLDTHIILARITASRRARDETLMRLDSAEATAKRIDNQLALAKIMYVRGYLFLDSHEFNRAMKYISDALRLFDTMGYLEGVANSRNIRGIIYIHLGQFQDARDQFEEQMIIQQQLNNQVGLARALINIGEVDSELGQLDQMEFYNIRALEISQEAEYMSGIAVATVNIGNVALRRADIDIAIEKYMKALEIARTSGLGYLEISIHFLLGDAYFLKQKSNKAIDMYQEAKTLSEKAGYQLSMFLADISTIMAYRVAGITIPEELLKPVRDVMSPLSDWLTAPTPALMSKLTRRIFDDSSISSQICIFYDRDLGFTCRVDRTGLKKECFGSLMWMGGFCPYFIKFIEFLRDSEDAH
ncbi:MAG: tetratricopeptide repeat protein [Candidatus Thorarchaeota archaeon]